MTCIIGLIVNAGFEVNLMKNSNETVSHSKPLVAQNHRVINLEEN